MSHPLRQLAAGMTLGLLSSAATGADATPPLPRVEIPNEQSALVRGADTVVNNCLVCHSLKYVRYRDLLELGVPPDRVDQWRGDKDISEPLLSMIPTEAGNGAAPPDLSLMAAARRHGDRYIYALLTGYERDAEGNIVNRVFPGIAMSDILGYSFADSDAQRAELEQTAREAAGFLRYAADPSAPVRHRMGVFVLGYLAVLTALLYLWKRRVWSRLDRTSA